MDKDGLVTDYIEQVRSALSELPVEKIERMVEILGRVSDLPP